MVWDVGLRADRVAEVIVSLPDGGGRRGSGYLVAAGTILTAAHVVAGATGIRVRFDADRPGERTVEAVVRWQHLGIDVAVLTSPGPDEVQAARFGRVAECDAVLHCSAMGFPRFKLRTSEDGSRYRDSEHVHATCAVLSNRREGTLDLSVTPPAESRDPDISGSPWEGMSGAAVLSGGLIVGLIAEHHRSDGPGRLAASRVDRWSELLTADERHQLEAALGCDLAPANLPDAIPPSPPGLIAAAYEAQLRDIAPDQLEGRDDELRQLVEFCAGSASYLWLQAPPCAGKTALAAWFALHPPRGVVPVWFFVTARLAGQADSTAYSEAVVHQLAMIAGREPDRHAPPAARDAERRLLLREAAERVARDGGTLLLIVDGLDEDQSALFDGGGSSIASLLPERPPPNVRVLVTSRLRPGIPPDVRGDHPLRHCTVSTLSTAAAARHTEHEAGYDLSRVLSGDNLDRDLVGLLAAARGSLTLQDLHELTGQQQIVLRQRLNGAFGRILGERGSTVDGAYWAEARGYLFAHETLFVAARNELGPDIPHYHERIHAWAQRYAGNGWPPETPLYLLQPYGRMVAALGDLDRATDLATDLRRHDYMREVTGSDTAGLAEIGMMRQAVRREDPDNVLGHLAALAAASDLMARRNTFLPPQVPIAVARLGHTHRAVGLARSVFRGVYRARALAGVAQVLAESGDPQACGLAREALEMEELVEEIRDEYTPTADETVQRAAVALMTAGQESEALARLDPLSKWRSEDPLPPFERRAAVAVAASRRNADCAAELLRETETMAEKLSSREEGIKALAVVARAYAMTDPAQATRVYNRLARMANKNSEARVLTAAATALRDARPDKAARFAQQAVEQARDELDYLADLPELRLGSDSDPEVDLVCALVAEGSVKSLEEAQEAVESAELLCYQEWEAIAMDWARVGRADMAWRALERYWDKHLPQEEWACGEERPEGAAAVATALAVAGSRRKQLLSRPQVGIRGRRRKHSPRWRSTARRMIQTRQRAW